MKNELRAILSKVLHVHYQNHPEYKTENLAGTFESILRPTNIVEANKIVNQWYADRIIDNSEFLYLVEHIVEYKESYTPDYPGITIQPLSIPTDSPMIQYKTPAPTIQYKTPDGVSITECINTPLEITTTRNNIARQ